MPSWSKGPVGDLLTRWNEEASTFDRYGIKGAAQMTRLHATELKAALRELDNELLDLAQAAEESGMSRDHLRHLVADEKIPNAGRKGSPLIRRADLPTKPSRVRKGLRTEDQSPEAEARQILRQVGK